MLATNQTPAAALVAQIAAELTSLRSLGGECSANLFGFVQVTYYPAFAVAPADFNFRDDGRGLYTVEGSQKVWHGEAVRFIAAKFGVKLPGTGV